ncbi:MAG: efflux RND transporter periplasmic adaptor subunit [Photobacterium frigidiphilum]|uniref:efflux RND transporter periplasmic adaptor subunit n=1 Tax=Photobacterium frigidiphilum TaxID=264736 RepID=UPI003002792A
MLRLLILFTVGTLVLTGCGAEAETGTDPRLQPSLVQFVAVKPDTSQQRTFTGTVEARVQSDLGFRVSGKITVRLVNTGQHVKKDQVLMRLDTEDFDLQVIASRKAVDAANADVFKANADEKRMRGLVKKGSVSAQSYDHALAALRSAKAQLAMTEANASVVENTNQYSKLVADADGVVVSTHGEPGQVVSAGQLVVKLAKDGLREAVVALPETIRPALGSEATANFFNSDLSPVQTHLRELSNSADSITRTYEARYVIESGNEPPLGSTVSITLNLPANQDNVLVPIGALYDDGQGSTVWVLDEESSTVSLRRVKISRITSETASVSGDFKAGELVAAMGVHRLHDNEIVRVAGNNKVAL